MPSATGAFTPSSPHGAEAGLSMGSDAFGSHAGIDGNANLSTEKTVVFTTAPMLGSPVQFNGQPVPGDVAAEAENSEDTLEQQALQPYSIPVNFSIVAAIVRKEALTRLVSNSMCLAAAIEEAGEPSAEMFPPESGGEVNLVRLQCSVLGFVRLHLADRMQDWGSVCAAPALALTSSLMC